VNGQLSYKVLPKGLSSGQPYTIDEYLSVIGEEGWEIVGCGTKALLYCTSSEHLGQMGQFAKVRFPSS
jgi:hypothetical protein